ncbi:hypothetical protein PHLCEN_2v2636 [Hermanssonia centrifuga]|uniref:peptidylprolyl isomerase n=1 Tax=Hermanssonia centrifuga TaxID=98765 RepID=A0A2R6RIM4_9APHY|nr:hypothetical protein PHLCEN_2v2636 [Hermanssonia centrifuga]
MPGQPEAFIVPNDLKVTNIALGEAIVEENGRTSVKMTYTIPGVSNLDDEDKDANGDAGTDPITGTTILCSLTPGKIEQATVDLILDEGIEIQFEAVGRKDEDDFSDDAYNLEGARSDGENDPDSEELEDDSAYACKLEPYPELTSIYSGIQEIEPPPTSKKRPRDIMDSDESKLFNLEKPSNKKLKAINGEAIPTSQKNVDLEAAVKKEKDKKVKAGADKPKLKVETKELAGGVEIMEHKVGSGPQAKIGDTVSVRYIGKLQNGKVFDSNTKGELFKFRLGAGEVIQGWDVGIVGMQTGGERLLTIPATMAYGKKARSGIPANSNLIFGVCAFQTIFRRVHWLRYFSEVKVVNIINTTMV